MHSRAKSRRRRHHHHLGRRRHACVTRIMETANRIQMCLDGHDEKPKRDEKIHAT